jgi:hypothetical protein
MFRTRFRRYFLSFTFDVARSGLKLEKACMCVCLCACVRACAWRGAPNLPHCPGIPFPQENINSRGRGKGKVHPRTGHESPEGEQRYSSNLSLTSALDGVVGQRHTPAALLPGKMRYPLYRRLGGHQGRSERVRKISSTTAIRSPDRPARSESLYRKSYPDPQIPEGAADNLSISKLNSQFRGYATYANITTW